MHKLYENIGNILPYEMYPINGYVDVYDENDKTVLSANALIEKDNDAISCHTTMDSWHELNNQIIPFSSDIKVASINVLARDIPLRYKYQLHAPINYKGCNDMIIKGKGRVESEMSFSFNTNAETNIEFKIRPIGCENHFVDIDVY